MWCQNGTTGDNVVSGKLDNINSPTSLFHGTDFTAVGGQFQVQPSGAFPYIMFTEDPTQAVFPVACHAQLVADQPNGGIGTDDPVGVTFTSEQNVAAKTFSLTTSTTSSSSSSITSSSSSTSVGSSSTTLPISPTSPSNAPVTSPTASSKAGLSGGAKAGIALAATLGVLAVIIGIACVFRRKRKSKSGEKNSAWEMDNKEAPGAARFGRYELEDEERRLHELSETTATPELHGGEAIYEMPADEKGNGSRYKVAPPPPNQGFI